MLVPGPASEPEVRELLNSAIFTERAATIADAGQFIGPVTLHIYRSEIGLCFGDEENLSAYPHNPAEGCTQGPRCKTDESGAQGITTTDELPVMTIHTHTAAAAHGALTSMPGHHTAGDLRDHVAADCRAPGHISGVLAPTGNGTQLFLVRAMSGRRGGLGLEHINRLSDTPFAGLGGHRTPRDVHREFFDAITRSGLLVASGTLVAQSVTHGPSHMMYWSSGAFPAHRLFSDNSLLGHS